MILGIGVDLTPISRLQRAFDAHPERLEARLFTDGERAYCRNKAHAAQHFAARFAAKEAALKALGTGLTDAGSLREVEVRDGGGAGALTIRLHDRVADLARARGVEQIHVACVSTRGCALAGVVLESGGRGHA